LDTFLFSSFTYKLLELYYKTTFQKQQNTWRHIPTPVELAQELHEDFLGFSEADSVG
jgi:hypothetical protein